MSWNIQKPGDYIVGPLTVIGAATISGDLTVDTNVLKVDTTLNRVGIGTASPTCDLDIFRASGSGITSGISLRTAAGAGGDGSFIKWLAGGTNEKVAQIDGVLNGTDVGYLSFLCGNGADAMAEQYRVASGGLFTWYNGAGGTRMVLNSTGLNVGNAPNANSRAWALQGFGYINGGDGNGIEYRNSGTGNSGYITNDNDRLNFNFLSGILISQGNVRIASGNGIDFSLSPNTAGATSEILNDYEEGTWTPVVTAATGTLTTVSSQLGYYTKVGRLVTAHCYFVVTANGTGGSSIQVSGLPFASSNAFNITGIVRLDGVTGHLGQIKFAAGGTVFNVWKYDNSYPAADGSQFPCVVTYFV